MKITIKDREIELKYGFRALMIYEKIYGDTFTPTGLSEMVTFFYSVIIASDKAITLTYDDFLDWLDASPTILQEFVEWLTSVYGINNFINHSEEGVEGDKSKKE